LICENGKTAKKRAGKIQPEKAKKKSKELVIKQ